MELVDFLAQLSIVLAMVLSSTREMRAFLYDTMDHNVERLIREEKDALEAQWWLEQMETAK